MTNKTELANMALGEIPDTLLTDLDTDSSLQARECRRNFQSVIDCALVFPYWWSTKRVALAAVTNDRDEWQFAYAVPDDCAQLRRLLVTPGSGSYYTPLVGQTLVTAFGGLTQPLGGFQDRLQQVPCEVSANTSGTLTIYTDLDAATAEITRNDIDVSVFPPFLVRSCAFDLASRICTALSRADKRPVLEAGALLWSQRAQAEALNQEHRTYDVIPEAYAVR
jgi:hypothetical protein